MKAVFEEYHGNQAVFVLDNYPAMFHVETSTLPKGTRIGDVFSVRLEEGQWVLDQKLEDEGTARKAAAKAKRERLLRRNKENE